jgi:nitrite reductase/ring-hydroxylating ferredoxin subunit
VAAATDLGVGAGMVVTAEGKTLALFNVDGSYYAIDNACPP